MQNESGYFVRKVGNVERNLERYKSLAIPYRLIAIPILFKIDVPDQYDMEYIHGLDMNTYLLSESPVPLITFIEESIFSLKESIVSTTWDYHSEYNGFLIQFDGDENLPFSTLELQNRLPRFLPKTQYHGDFTLENILYDVSSQKFYTIDPVTVPFDSYVFDLAKLLQDVQCKWFVRNHKYKHYQKLAILRTSILEQFPKYVAEKQINALIILMLLRVYRHTQENTLEYNFLLEEIRKLW